MNKLPHATTTLNNRLGARWVLAAGVAGLVAAGALAGGLITHQMTAEAKPGNEDATALSEPAQVTPTTPARSAQQHQTTHAARPAPTPERHAAAQVCSSCGVVESVRAENHEGSGSGVGAVAGGLIGGLLGNQMGGGDGRKAMTVVGAVGGGLAGNEIEKRRNASTVYVTQVRMDDGSVRTFNRNAALSTGQRVTVNGQELRLERS